MRIKKKEKRKMKTSDRKKEKRRDVKKEKKKKKKWAIRGKTTTWIRILPILPYLAKSTTDKITFYTYYFFFFLLLFECPPT